MISDKDIDTMARTVWGEARGESLLGKAAVAHVILNRVKADKWYGKTIHGVCKKPYQFSCWNIGDPNREKMQAVDLGDEHYRDCMFVTIAAIKGWIPDPTKGSDHYCAKTVSPKWSKGKKPARTIGVHQFYNNIE
jgi:spore germination cell wall hydrolase CwlJ-like protein